MLRLTLCSFVYDSGITDPVVQSSLLVVKPCHDVADEKDHATDDVHEISPDRDAPSERLSIASHHLHSQCHFAQGRSLITKEHHLVQNRNGIRNELKAHPKTDRSRSRHTGDELRSESPK